MFYRWTVDELLLTWPIFAVAGGFLIALLVGKLREIRRRTRAKGIILCAPPTPAPDLVYTRREWLRDMHDTDLSIEEISVRVVRSNGAWRLPPADPPPPSSIEDVDGDEEDSREFSKSLAGPYSVLELIAPLAATILGGTLTGRPRR